MLRAMPCQRYPKADNQMHSASEHLRRNARKWDARAETYDQKRFDYFRWMQRKALSFLYLRPGMQFLDLGCGTGFAVRYAAAQARHEGLFCGVDISRRMIEVAREKSGSFNCIRFEVASAEALPLGSDSFDAIVCTNSFHHYAHPSVALAEIHRVLRPGGRLCIMDVTADNCLIRWMDARVQRKEPEHVRFYSSKEYARMFAEGDLKLVMSRTFLPPMKVHVAEKTGAK